MQNFPLIRLLCFPLLLPPLLEAPTACFQGGQRLGSPGGTVIKIHPPVREMWVWSLGWDYPMEEEMATYSSILAWRLQSMGSQSRTQLSGWALTYEPEVIIHRGPAQEDRKLPTHSPSLRYKVLCWRGHPVRHVHLKSSRKVSPSAPGLCWGLCVPRDSRVPRDPSKDLGAQPASI